MAKEIIQVKTDRYGYEIMCTINRENTWIQDNGFSHKCNQVLDALRLKYPDDEFRVLQEGDEYRDLDQVEDDDDQWDGCP